MIESSVLPVENAPVPPQQIPGAAPGNIDAAIGLSRPRISVIAYNRENLLEREFDSLDGLKQLADEYRVVWINVDGLGDTALLKSFQKQFGLHLLALEDVVQLNQRPKLEEYSHYLFVIARMMSGEFESVAGGSRSVNLEQLSLFLSDRFVISFQERHGDCLEPVRERLRTSSGRIRARGSDYLLYAILDSVVDFYFPVGDRMAERLDEIDDSLSTESSQKTQLDLLRMRRTLVTLRKAVRPHREVLNELMRDDHISITDETRVYLRDCYDHVLHIGETIDNCRELSTDLRDYHLALVGNRTNEVMRTLTIIATIFIPLSFLAGLYGMNFQYMPELQFRYGYFVALAVMAGIAGGLVLWFRRKGWFEET